MANEEKREQMSIKFVSNGDPERLPKIGEQLPIKEPLFFVVEGYGESHEIVHEDETYYEIDLLGHLQGSPMSVFEDLLEGKL